MDFESPFEMLVDCYGRSPAITYYWLRHAEQPARFALQAMRDQIKAIGTRSGFDCTPYRKRKINTNTKQASYIYREIASILQRYNDVFRMEEIDGRDWYCELIMCGDGSLIFNDETHRPEFFDSIKDTLDYIELRISKGSHV